MLSLSTISILPSRAALVVIPSGKILINTINAHSYNVARTQTHVAALRKNFHLHYADMSDSMSLVKLVGKVQPTEIYNLAAQSHVKPEDFVIATGVQHSVREFAYHAFKAAGMELNFEGDGIDEKGICVAGPANLVGKTLIEVLEKGVVK